MAWSAVALPVCPFFLRHLKSHVYGVATFENEFTLLVLHWNHTNVESLISMSVIAYVVKIFFWDNSILFLNRELEGEDIRN